jgi:hypothetical protein
MGILRGLPRVVPWRAETYITEMNRICLVLFDMNNRKFGPYLAATDKILISVMIGTRLW